MTVFLALLLLAAGGFLLRDAFRREPAINFWDDGHSLRAVLAQHIAGAALVLLAIVLVLS